MAGKRPSLQFYPGDWLRDPGVRSVSYAARGLWIDMLCLMFESDRKGYLCVAGKPVSATAISRMTGGNTDEVSQLLTELESSGVFSRTEHGMIYSRRMVRDEHKRQLCQEAGKRGGNPTLKGQSKGQANPKTTPSSSSSSSVGDESPTTPLVAEAATRAPTAAEFLEAWNAVTGFTQVRSFSSKRQRQFRARCRDPAWVRDWREALAKASAKPFCRGHNDRGWVATVDWFLRPDTVVRLMEGHYLDSGTGPPPEQPATMADRQAKTLRDREKAAQERGSVDPEAARAFREHLHGRNGDA